ncbi:MAG: archaellin/type IV pilin N-terminal domain-containing protein [Candidatus Woesearchaeota archaeon]
MDIFHSKKGVSPLIATILLIVFSIALGAVVMSWGEAYIEEKAEFVQTAETGTGCSSAHFSLVNIAGVPQICFRQNLIEMIIDNSPAIDIADIHTRIVGSKDVYVRESVLDSPLKKGSSKKVVFPIADVGEIKQIKFTPQVYIGNTLTMCPQGALLIERIIPCI